MIRSTKRMVRKGQAMIEYALLVVCVAVVGAAAVSMLGHKTADTLGIASAIMPGDDSGDNSPINTEQAVPTTVIGGNIVLDTSSTTGLLRADRFFNVFGQEGAASTLVGQGP